MFRYLRGTYDYSLTLGGNIEVIGYTDAAYGDDIPTGRSTAGYLFFVGSGAVTWSSKRQQVVALSTTEAEYMAAAHAAKEAIWISGFLSEIGVEGHHPIHLKGDNTGSIDLSKDSQFHPRTKHINMRYHFIRECVNNGHIALDYVPTNAMVADALTKPLAVGPFSRFVSQVGLRAVTDSSSSLSSRTSGSVERSEHEE